MSYFDYQHFSQEFLSKTYTKTLYKNEILFSSGDDTYGVFYVKKGMFKMIAYPDSEQSIVLYHASEEQIFAEEHLFLEQYSYSAIAEESSNVLVFPKQHFLNEIDHDKEKRLAFLSCVSSRYFNLRVNMERMAIRSAKERVLHLLHTIAMHEGKLLNLKGRMKGFAEDLNLTHETIYRCMKQLEEEQRITRCKGKIKIL